MYMFNNQYKLQIYYYSFNKLYVTKINSYRYIKKILGKEVFTYCYFRLAV